MKPTKSVCENCLRVLEATHKTKLRPGKDYIALFANRIKQGHCLFLNIGRATCGTFLVADADDGQAITEVPDLCPYKLEHVVGQK